MRDEPCKVPRGGEPTTHTEGKGDTCSHQEATSLPARRSSAPRSCHPQCRQSACACLAAEAVSASKSIAKRCSFKGRSSFSLRKLPRIVPRTEVGARRSYLGRSSYESPLPGVHCQEPWLRFQSRLLRLLVLPYLLSKSKFLDSKALFRWAEEWIE